MNKDFKKFSLLDESIKTVASNSTSPLPESVEESRIKVFETNLSLAYDELAYIVHYRNNDYLCIGLRLHRNHTDSFCVGDLAKFEDHEIKYFKESKFKLEDSPLWSLNFAAWLKEVYLPFQYHQTNHSAEVERLREGNLKLRDRVLELENTLTDLVLEIAKRV